MGRMDLPPSKRPHRQHTPGTGGSTLSMEERLVRSACILAGTWTRKDGITPEQAEEKVMGAFRKAIRGEAKFKPHTTGDGEQNHLLDAPAVLLVAMQPDGTDAPLKLPLDDMTAERLCAVVQRGLADHRGRDYDWTRTA
jgi:hypothetical protein